MCRRLNPAIIAVSGIGRSGVDVVNIENVEVLKGPAAMIHGRVEPGGMINVVTKKPLDPSHYSLEQEFGSFSLYCTTVDATWTDQPRRLVALSWNLLILRFQPIHHAGAARQNLLCRAQLDLETDQQTRAEYQHRVPQYKPNGMPAIGNHPADIPINLYLGGDIGDHANVRRKLVDFNGLYQFNSNWNLRGAVAVAAEAPKLVRPVRIDRARIGFLLWWHRQAGRQGAKVAAEKHRGADGTLPAYQHG